MNVLRVYLNPADVGMDGYPLYWHRPSYLMDWVTEPPFLTLIPPNEEHIRAWQEERDVTASWEEFPPIKDLVREQAENRCVRCGHPYRPGRKRDSGEWSPCDEECTHGAPVRAFAADGDGPYTVEFGEGFTAGVLAGRATEPGERVEAQWRILTVHHLNGVKHDCRWWNLVALCQRCHLSVQTRVVMDRPYWGEHSDWFQPYVAGFYAATLLGEELDRDEVMSRLDELLALENRQQALDL